MKLTASNIFDAPAAAVCAGMGDPDFYAGLQLPDLEAPELLVRTVAGDRVDIHVRFTYTGKLDSIARRIVGHDHVSWIQRLVIDPTTRSCTLSVAPEGGVVPVACTGRFELHDADGGQCLRTLAGELRIKVPIIGSRAEKSLAPGIMRRIDLEAPFRIGGDVGGPQGNQRAVLGHRADEVEARPPRKLAQRHRRVLPVVGPRPGRDRLDLVHQFLEKVGERPHCGATCASVRLRFG